MRFTKHAGNDKLERRYVHVLHASQNNENDHPHSPLPAALRFLGQSPQDNAAGQRFHGSLPFALPEDHLLLHAGNLSPAFWPTCRHVRSGRQGNGGRGVHRPDIRVGRPWDLLAQDGRVSDGACASV